MDRRVQGQGDRRGEGVSVICRADDDRVNVLFQEFMEVVVGLGAREPLAGLAVIKVANVAERDDVSPLDAGDVRRGTICSLSKYVNFDLVLARRLDGPTRARRRSLRSRRPGE